MLITIKSKEDIGIMHEANHIVHRVLDSAEDAISPGITTLELNSIMELSMSKFPGATSTFKGYGGFPAVSCISVNEEIVHGIPGSRIIEEGDIVSVDFGVHFKGFVGDAARTFVVGSVSDEISRLVKETRLGLLAGINAMVPGNYLYDINSAIELVAARYGYGNVKGFSGHGIGRRMHESPPVYNYKDNTVSNFKLREGMVFALEPMFTLGSSDAIVKEDGWTAVTDDNSLASHLC